MKAARIIDGVVEGYYMVESYDSSFIDPKNSKVGDAWVNGKFVSSTPEVVIPQVVSPRQIRQAMSRVGLRQAVEDAIAAASAGGDQDTKDWYEFATEFVRTNPHVIALAASLNVSVAQLDALWTLADSL